MLFATVSSVLLLFALAVWSRSRAYRALATTALAGHLALALVVPALPYRWDVHRFHAAATAIASGSVPSTYASVNAFSAFQGILYVVFGSTPTTLSVVNGLLAVLTPIPVVALARRLYPSAVDSTDGVAALVLFAPLAFLFSTLPMRDALSTLLFFVALRLVTDVFVASRHWHAVVAVPLVALLSTLRPELALLVVVGSVAAGVAWVLDAVGRRDVSFASLTVAVSPASVTGFLLFAREFPLAYLNRVLERRSVGGAVYLDGLSYVSWADVLVLAPVRAVYFQFAPFPLHVDSAFDLLAALELPVLLVLAIAAYRSLAACDTDQRVSALLLTAYLGGVVGYGLIDSNFGTTVRHRVPFVFLLVVFASPVVERHWRALRGESR
ncbi:hypothetical protein [Halorussus caseinilyticus]|uniref:Glycosyltransferase RgtA/B/C/D-like domain-containing protein n=1 Tax=Halorussus caseinilyticus TaxID=3034025 RepID=A0ABD5WUS3_9EURY|nr:hypothetical protein [Halorussus sp. DT72]